jgi:phosphate starvation-inducible PhoH-like protein
MENKTSKKELKNPIAFGVQLSEEQKEAKSTILNNDITIIRGSAGSGKSLLACQVGLDGFFRGVYGKLVIARPAVSAGEDIGFLPGTEKEKILGYLLPILDNINALYGDTKAKRDKIEKHLESGEIEIVSVGKLRGRTFTNAFVIIDEFQNVTPMQAYLITTRLGKNSKMVVTGDIKQKDIKGITGLDKLLSLVDRIEGLAAVELKQNHRSGIVKRLIEEWED